MATRDALTALIEDLVPTDDTPGAAEAGTAASVRAALAERPPLAALVEQGLRALDRAAEQQGGHAFAALPPAQRHALLARLARGSPPPGWTAADPLPELFWTTLRGLAVGLFYGSPLGHRLAGFPGACIDSGGYTHTIVEPDPLGHRT